MNREQMIAHLVLHGYEPAKYLRLDNTALHGVKADGEFSWEKSYRSVWHMPAGMSASSTISPNWDHIADNLLIALCDRITS